MHAITYDAPRSLDQALDLLRKNGPTARVFCGGTDIIIQMRAGVRRPDHLIDVKGISELRKLSFDAKKGLCLGAAVPCVEVFESALMREHYPGLTEAAHLIGSLQIQARASVGGNLCNGSPAADSTPALIALGAVAKIASVRGERKVPVDQFVTAPGRTVLEPDELLVEVHVPAPPKHSADAYLRFIPRNEMDIAVVGVGAAVTLKGDRCVAARIGLGAVAPTPLLADEASKSLVDSKLDERAVEHAAELAVGASSPIDDMRGTAEFRRHLVGVLTRRAVDIAAERARAR